MGEKNPTSQSDSPLLELAIIEIVILGFIFALSSASSDSVGGAVVMILALFVGACVSGISFVVGIVKEIASEKEGSGKGHLALFLHFSIVVVGATVWVVP